MCSRSRNTCGPDGEAYARTRNARVFWGRAPEGGGAPAYWLFTQVLRRFLDDVDESAARRLLGEDAAQLARIGRIRDPIGDPPARPRNGADEPLAVKGRDRGRVGLAPQRRGRVLSRERDEAPRVREHGTRRSDDRRTRGTRRRRGRGRCFGRKGRGGEGEPGEQSHEHDDGRPEKRRPWVAITH